MVGGLRGVERQGGLVVEGLSESEAGQGLLGSAPMGD